MGFCGEFLKVLLDTSGYLAGVVVPFVKSDIAFFDIYAWNRSEYRHHWRRLRSVYILKWNIGPHCDRCARGSCHGSQKRLVWLLSKSPNCRNSEFVLSLNERWTSSSHTTDVQLRCKRFLKELRLACSTTSCVALAIRRSSRVPSSDIDGFVGSRASAVKTLLIVICTSSDVTIAFFRWSTYWWTNAYRTSYYQNGLKSYFFLEI